MNEVDEYVRSVIQNIHAPAEERKRIGDDLRSHLEAAVQAGEPAIAAIARMGSPLQVAAEFMAEISVRYASFWRRLVAFIIDYAVFVASAFLFAALAVVPTRLVPKHPQGLDWVLGAVMITAVLGLVIAAVGIIVLYFPILEGRFGQTVGKRLLGMRVLKENRLPIGYKEAFLRRLSFYFEFLTLDALFIPFTARHQRAFDIVARTIVVRKPA